MTATDYPANIYGEHLTVWANGFGVWHVRVDLPRGYTSGEMLVYGRRHADRARARIRKEIAARQGQPPARVYVDIEEVSRDGLGRVISVVYKER